MAHAVQAKRGETGRVAIFGCNDLNDLGANIDNDHRAEWV